MKTAKTTGGDVTQIPCLISGFHCTVNETCSLLEYHAVQSGCFLLIFRDNLFIP